MPRRALGAAGLTAIVAAACAAPTGAQPMPAPAAPAVQVNVSIDPAEPGRAVARGFLGLSFEAAALARLGQYAYRGDLVRMLRSLGPGVVRFGGITADENVAWTDSQTPRPAWASSTIGPAQLSAIGVLARRSGWRVLLTVGMAHYEPAAAAREVAFARRALGSSLQAVELGNEPNAYGDHGFREQPWLAQGYEEQASAYREAIDALSPGTPIAGPDVSGSSAFPEWGSEEALAQSPVLLTGHHYPLGCASDPPPSIEALLSAQTRGAAALSLATYTKVAGESGIPVRIDETNSVSCGGVAGISDTFASALWAVGYIAQAMAAGTAGVNFEGNPENCTGYTPLCAPSQTELAQGELRAQPEWYALLLCRSLIGWRALPTTISAVGAAPNLVAAAFVGPGDALKYVLVDDEPPGSAPLALNLQVGAGLGDGRVLRMTAPSPSATGGVGIDGVGVAPDGAWREPYAQELAPTTAGVATVLLQPSSAALVTVPVAAPVRRHHEQEHRSGAKR